MRLSITNELSFDLDAALELASELGIQSVELRGIGEHCYPDVSRFMLARVPELLSEYRLPVVSLSPSLFKITLPKAVPEKDRYPRSRWPKGHHSINIPTGSLHGGGSP
jgi:sugar phosphate isomerase/epimerase